MNIFEKGETKPVEEGQSLESDARYEECAKWVEDLTPYIKANKGKKYEDNKGLYKETLQKIPKHAWMEKCEFNLCQVPEEDPSIQGQRAYLECLIQELKRETLTLDNAVLKGVQKEGKVLAIDLEATGLDTRIMFTKDKKMEIKTEIVGICLGVSINKGYYIPVLHTEEDGVSNFDYQVCMDFLTQLNQEFITVYHNGLYDREIMYMSGVQLRPHPYWYDTLLCYHLIDPDNKQKGLKKLSEEILGRPMLEISELFPEAKKKQLILFNSLTAKTAVAYAVSDAVNTLALFVEFLSPKTNWVFETCIKTIVPIDHKVSDSTRAFTRVGLPLKVQKSILNLKDLIRRSTIVQNKVYNQIGYQFNLGSPKDLNKVLFEDLGLSPSDGVVAGKSGLYPTGEPVLEQLSKDYPDETILKMIVIYRKINSQQNFHAKVITNSTLDYHRDHFWGQLQFSLTTVPTGRYSSSSSKGSPSVRVKFNKTSITKTYKEGCKTIGMNSQGIPVVYAYTMPFKSIKKESKLFARWTKDTKDLYHNLEEPFFKALTKPKA